MKAPLVAALLLLLNALASGFSPSQISVLTSSGRVPAPPIDPDAPVSAVTTFRRGSDYGPWLTPYGGYGGVWEHSPYYYRGGLYGTNMYGRNRYDYGYNGLGGTSGNPYYSGRSYYPYRRPYSYDGYHSYDPYSYGGYGSMYGGYGGYGSMYGGYGGYGYGGYGSSPYYSYGPSYGGYGSGFGYNSLWQGRDMYRYPIGGGYYGGGYGMNNWNDATGYGPSFFGYGYNGLGGTSSNPYYHSGRDYYNYHSGPMYRHHPTYYGGGGYGMNNWYDSAGYGPSFFGYGHNGLGGTSSNPYYHGYNSGPLYGHRPGYHGGYYGGGFYGGVGFGAPYYNQPGGMLTY